MTAVFPFHLLSDGDLATLQDEFKALGIAWSEEWFATHPEGEFVPWDEAAAAFPGQDRWEISYADAETWVAWQLPPGAWRDYGRLLLNAAVPGASPSPLVKTLLHDCFADLASRLLSRAVPDSCSARTVEGSLEMVRNGHGAGSVRGYLGNGFPQLGLAMGHAVVSALLGPRRPGDIPDEPLAPRELGIAAGVVRLEVILGHAELSLAELASVSPGDVIRLHAPFREPLTVVNAEGSPIVRARLGKLGDARAIQITNQ